MIFDNANDYKIMQGLAHATYISQILWKFMYSFLLTPKLNSQILSVQRGTTSSSGYIAVCALPPETHKFGHGRTNVLIQSRTGQVKTWLPRQHKTLYCSCKHIFSKHFRRNILKMFYNIFSLHNIFKMFPKSLRSFLYRTLL